MDNQQWHEWRRKGLGSSDAAVIMQVSPWKTLRQLWEEKVYGNSVQLENSSMTRGKELEPVARSWFEETMNVTVFPENRTHQEHQWIRASLDGIDLNGSVMVEIKCPNREDHATAVNKRVPEKYWPQVQHQLLVTGLPGMYYCSFTGAEGAIVEVARDDDYIDSMFEEEKKFWDLVLSQKAPELTDKDFLSMEGKKDWEKIATRWTHVNKALKCLESEESELRKQLIALSDNHNAYGSGIKISKTMCEGSIDYKKLKTDFSDLPWESYRKDPVLKWNFRVT